MTLEESEARIRELTAERDEALRRLDQCAAVSSDVFLSSLPHYKAYGSIPIEQQSDDYQRGFIVGNSNMASQIVVITMKKEPVNA